MAEQQTSVTMAKPLAQHKAFLMAALLSALLRLQSVNKLASLCPRTKHFSLIIEHKTQNVVEENKSMLFLSRDWDRQLGVTIDF